MLRHRFILWGGVLLVTWLAGATHAAESDRAAADQARTASRKVVLELSGMT